MASVSELLQSHPHWSAVKEIYHKLQSHGYKAFLAGGCVRDALLGRKAHDLDVATDATPDKIENLFEKTVAVGKSFGVMRVLLQNADIEVATFRSDGSYKDGRRPEEVHFSSPQEDAKRRDFTVNALFFDLATGQVLDFVEGQKDLQKRSLATVGDARKRFGEDHLRLLRAARFVAQLDFSLEAETFAALKDMAGQVKTVSGERLRDEMAKLLRAPHALKGLDVMVRSGLMQTLFPFRGQDASVDFLNLALTPYQAFALFLAKASKADLGSSLQTLRLSVKEQRAIERAWNLWQAPQAFFSQSLGKQLMMMAEEGVSWALTILKVQGQSPESIAKIENSWKQWGEQLPPRLLDGHDIQGLQGREIGLCLEQAYEMQLERRLNTREEALKWLQTYKK